MKRPDLDILLHRITFIEEAGTGIKRMRDEAHDHKCPAPIFEDNGFFTAIFHPNPEVRAQADSRQGTSTPQVNALEIGTKLAPSRHQVEILRQCREESPLVDLIAVVGRSDRTKFRNQVLRPLIDAGLLEVTLPDKPRSPIQRYRITPLGRESLNKGQKECLNYDSYAPKYYPGLPGINGATKGSKGTRTGEN
jgi:ATP-dependent DNA helicase RecG